ncbi:MAG: AmmeMemoRadiSam system radical SAM enzyme [Gammaproteobacteria bacterium]|nr:AmmeMemoRadiSam system radical SAM enzyme [Gammaproteobacteria bacterium]
MEDFIKETKYWHKLEDDRIQCDLCPRVCRLREGQKGLCFVRERQNDQIVLTTYGRSSGFCIDPVEKKPLNHFLPGSSVFSFGTAGCNLACKFCQNWDISKSREIDTLADSASPEHIANTAKKLGCQSVAFTYNDPVIFHEYAIEIAKCCHELNINAIAVTAGYICPEPRREFFSYMDAANIDLKAFSEKFYRKLTGSDLQTVLETLIYLKQETKVWFEITTLLIPGENDSDQEIEKMSQWILDNLGVDVPLFFTAFHPDWKMQDKPATPLSTLIRAREIAIKNGLRYVYTGNKHNPETETTYCPNCQRVLIQRDWHQISTYNVVKTNQCPDCHQAIPGVFERGHGTWGRHRQPIRLSGLIGED